MGFSYPSTQRHYRRLIFTTYTATCFGHTTIFRQKSIISYNILKMLSVYLSI
jgi:hypothetical protein